MVDGVAYERINKKRKRYIHQVTNKDSDMGKKSGETFLTKEVSMALKRTELI